MQGLAVADFLTAFSSYGQQPLFQSKYICESNYCITPYPYCYMAFHMSVTSFTFHTTSFMITTCLGIQKVIAIMCPIWTKNNMTKSKAVFCCVVIFLLSIAISFPRHFALEWTQCSLFHTIDRDGILQYSSIYYLITQTVLVTSCCIVMLLSSAYIVYKLMTNKFRGRMTEQRRQERRSVIMIVMVLMIFLITEVPKVSLYLWWCTKYMSGEFLSSLNSRNKDDSHEAKLSSVMLLVNFEEEMAWQLFALTDILGPESMNIIRYLLEGIKIFTVVGCLSNFIIYIIMSTKLRNEIISVFNKRINSLTHDIEMNQIQEHGIRSTNEIK
ncbi:MRGPRX [Mytilus coruscus]|uniref:MRGPRX n=1 Tax=Mytilus coruscus TaxID=42192 RepID=A0A6J8BFF1_MYTCO|nr:MRGPRX [Mytilus coruscus]